MGRAGKAKGIHDGWWNLESSDGTQGSVDFNKIDQFEELLHNSDEKEEYNVILIAQTKEEVSKAKQVELEQWKLREVYTEEKAFFSTLLTLRKALKGNSVFAC